MRCGYGTGVRASAGWFLDSVELHSDSAARVKHGLSDSLSLHGTLPFTRMLPLALEAGFWSAF